MIRDDLATLDDAELLALCAWGEARGEPVEGQIGQMCSIRNRVVRGSWFGNDYPGVILKPMQYSCFNAEDPNYKKILELASRFQDAISEGEQPINQLWWLASGIIAGHLQDNTHGATHYYSDSITSTPTWAMGKLVSVKLGRHIFLTV